MKQAPFLARKTFGQPNYLLLAMAAAFLVALGPFGARRTIQSNSNRPDEWLPASTAAVQDLEWFRRQFDGQHTVLVAWDGSTLENPGQLRRLARELSPRGKQSKWFAGVVTGPDVLAELTSPPLNLPRDEAISRLEGTLIGPALRSSGGKTSRAACMAVQLSPEAMRDERTLRTAIELIPHIASTECGVNRAAIRMAGAPIDDIAADDNSQATLLRLAPLAALISLAVCWWRLGSLRAAMLVSAVGMAGGMLALAAVTYFGVFEVLVLGAKQPGMGIADALLMSLPVIAYVAAMAAAIRMVRYHQQAGREGGAEHAAALAWQPTIATALVAAAGLAALYLSELEPMRKFGLFAPIGLILATVLALLVVPVVLHRFASLIPAATRRAKPNSARGAMRASLSNPSLVGACGLIALVCLTPAALRLKPAVQMPPLLDDESRLLEDYAWFESHLGNAIPAEMVVTVPLERCREDGEPAEADGQQYRMTVAERARLIDDIHQRLAKSAGVSGVLSTATFLADDAPANAIAPAAMGDDYQRTEHDARSDRASDRELWRLTARMKSTSLDTNAAPKELTAGLRHAVEAPILALQQRDFVVRSLHERGRQLADAKLCVLFRAGEGADTPPEEVQERVLADLLASSGIAPGGVSYFNLRSYDHPPDAAAAAGYRERAVSALRELDAVILASAARDPTAERLAGQGVNVVDVSSLPRVEETAGQPPVEIGGPRPVCFVSTGMMPVVEEAQGRLTASLRQCASASAVLLAVGLMFALRSAVGGAAAMIPALLPAAAIGAGLSWLGVGVDFGFVLPIALAVFLGVEGTTHYLAAYRRAAAEGLDRHRAAVTALDDSAVATVDIALAACIGLTVFVASGLASMELLGMLAVPLLLLSIAANLVVMPSLAASPLGRFFGAVAHETATATERVPMATGQSLAPAPSPAMTGAVAAKQPVLAADMRKDAAEGPHSALHAKLQRLRRSSSND